MRLLELARAVGDAVRHAGDARDVLVIVGARAGDQLGGRPSTRRIDAIERRR